MLFTLTYIQDSVFAVRSAIELFQLPYILLKRICSPRMYLPRAIKVSLHEDKDFSLTYDMSKPSDVHSEIFQRGHIHVPFESLY